MSQQLITTYAYTENDQQAHDKMMMLKNVALAMDRQTFFITFERQNTNEGLQLPLQGGGTGPIIGPFGSSFKIDITNVSNIIKSVKGNKGNRMFEIRFMEGYVARDYSYLQRLISSPNPPLSLNQRYVQAEPVYIKLHVSTNTTPYDFSIAPGYDKGQGATIYIEDLPSSILSFDIGALDCSPGQAQGCIDEMNQWIVVNIPDPPNPDLECNIHTNQQATSVNFRLAVRVLHNF